ncbi:MAG: hypothetical protein OJF49_002043 [Ktedonobacterales bacterium]|nr:MAG: hypothetical protein OJF49_002043 [Ktedonobacterales bacterium]
MHPFPPDPRWTIDLSNHRASLPTLREKSARVYTGRSARTNHASGASQAPVFPARDANVSRA